MKTALAAALLLVAGFALAEDPKPAAPTTPAPTAAPEAKGEIQKINAEIKDDRKAIIADKQAIRKDDEAQQAQVADLNAQEKAAVDAVRADKTKSPAERRTAIAAIRADFLAKKEAVRATEKSDRQAKREDIKEKREEIKKERHERHEIREQRRKHREGERKGK